MRLIDADELMKKIEDTRNSYYKTGSYIDDVVASGMCEAEIILMQAPTIEAEPKWIPVTERLPEVWESVLVTSGHLRVRDIRIAFVNENMEWASIWHSVEPDILAWMPLPEPYKGE